MTSIAPLEIRMSDTMQSVTLSVRVVGAKRARARLWLGSQIIRLAAVVIGCGVEIEIAS